MLTSLLFSSSFFLPNARTSLPRAGAGQPVPAAAVCMREEVKDEGLAFYEEYIKNRGSKSLAEAEAEYLKFKTLKLGGDEFDGGDSGSGAVGDGNVDLEDQHNSATLGALRGGISEAGATTAQVGRGNVQYNDLPDENENVKGTTEARTVSARGNYFGRTTGYAEKFMDKYTEKDFRDHRVDSVRAQQMENWQNQQAMNAANRQSGQGTMFGSPAQTGASNVRNRAGAYDPNAQSGDMAINKLEISQADLTKHLDDLASAPAERLDGEEWGPVTAAGADLEESYALRAPAGGVQIQEIKVVNMFNTFAPYRVAFAPGASSEWSVSPTSGSMNRRDGAPIAVTVRFNPNEYGEARAATLVFETEDMKKVYSLIGST